MKASYMQRGEALDFLNAKNTALAAGSIVVVGKRLGIVAGDIRPGETGAIEVEGVFEMPLKTAASGEIAQGTELYWEDAGLVIASGSNTVNAGYAAAPAAAGATVVTVKINA